MKKIVFAYPDNEALAKKITKQLNATIGKFILRAFPDQETYLKILSDVSHSHVIIAMSLIHPNEKLLPLIFFSETLKSLGAKKITLVAPYLAYMRQDKRFHAGEAISSQYFGRLLSQYIDQLITVDPHLHRYRSLDEIFSISTKTLTASTEVAKWIKKHIKKPLFIGPDSESRQWVSTCADVIQAPYVVLEKTRIDDRTVEITVPSLNEYATYTPVLIDDIISTGYTMIKAIKKIKRQLPQPPTCIAVHGVFTENAFNKLKKVGANQIITCNTIPHVSNVIDLSKEISAAVEI